MVRLFRAKMQLIRKHWSPRTRWLGPRLLAMWAFTRMVALAGLAIVRPARRNGFRAWREVWRRRREFALPAAQ
jgi:hypothetical protein